MSENKRIVIAQLQLLRVYATALELYCSIRYQDNLSTFSPNIIPLCYILCVFCTHTQKKADVLF